MRLQQAGWGGDTGAQLVLIRNVDERQSPNPTVNRWQILDHSGQDRAPGLVHETGEASGLNVASSDCGMHGNCLHVPGCIWLLHLANVYAPGRVIYTHFVPRAR